jgi:hypothetical protein
MGYVAIQHLTWGDELLNPGDEVPGDDASRDYGSLLRLGQIAEHPDSEGIDLSAGLLSPEVLSALSERDRGIVFAGLRTLGRDELDLVAVDLDIEEPDKLANKDAVVAAIHEKSTAAS